MRDKSIDILKGLSILSIMLLHYEQGLFPTWLNVWIGSFMISAFYFTSGWIQGGKPEPTLQELLKKRWKSIGVPYLWFSVLLMAVSLVFWGFGHYDSRIVLRDIYKTVTLRGIGTLWFLPALFGGELLAWKFRHDRLLGRMLLCVLTLAFGVFYNYWDTTLGHLNDTWRVLDAPIRTVSNIANAWLPVVLGYYLSKFFREELDVSAHWRKLLLGVLVLVWYSITLYGCGGGTGCLCQTLGPFGLLLLCQVVSTAKCLSMVAWFGRNSLVVMATHYSITQEICVIINRHWGKGTEMLEGWIALVFFAVSLPVEVVFVRFINRYLPFFLGKVSVNK